MGERDGGKREIEWERDGGIVRWRERRIEGREGWGWREERDRGERDGREGEGWRDREMEGERDRGERGIDGREGLRGEREMEGRERDEQWRVKESQLFPRHFQRTFSQNQSVRLKWFCNHM